jgi:hypothetical protein
MDGPRNADGRLALFRHNLRSVEGGDQILAYVQELMAERDELAKRQEHLNSLARLVEKTVSDADDLAAQIRHEAEERAQARIKDLTAQAESQARTFLEETRSKAMTDAESEVRALRAGAEQELDALIEEQTAALRGRAKEVADRLQEALLKEADESNRRLGQLQADLEKRLASLRRPTAIAGNAAMADEGQATLRSAAPAEVSAEASAAVVAAGPLKTPAPESPVSPSSRVEDPDRADIVEVEILPPRDKEVIEGIRNYLGLQDEVGAADIRHLTDKTLIEVHLLRPMDVAERIARLPEVEEVRTTTDADHSRIQIVLSVRSEMERARGGLNSKANRIASRIGGLSR